MIEGDVVADAFGQFLVSCGEDGGKVLTSRGLLKKQSSFTGEGERLLRNEFEKKKISARGYFRIKKLARTIADINDREDIQAEDVFEAMFFRNISDKGEENDG